MIIPAVLAAFVSGIAFTLFERHGMAGQLIVGIWLAAIAIACIVFSIQLGI